MERPARGPARTGRAPERLIHADAARRLLELRQRLLEEDAGAADARATVELDPSSLGRLSRMDAMQQQMALAEQRRRQQSLKRIEAALRRIADGSYGARIACGEPVTEARGTWAPRSHAV